MDGFIPVSTVIKTAGVRQLRALLKGLTSELAEAETSVRMIHDAREQVKDAIRRREQPDQMVVEPEDPGEGPVDDDGGPWDNIVGDETVEAATT